MDEFQQLRCLLTTILAMGFNGSTGPGGDWEKSVDVAFDQADRILEHCGAVDPNTVDPQ